MPGVVLGAVVTWSQQEERLESSEGKPLVVLFARLQRGEEAAWSEFHREYSPRLYRYLLVVTGGREDAAAEALQQTWLRCVRHLRPFHSEAALWSWLTVLARSSLIDEERKQGRFRRFLERWKFWDSGPSAEPDPCSDLEAQLLTTLQSELSELEPDERELVEAKYLQRQATRTLAEAWGTTEKALESRLSRIRGKLRAKVAARLKEEMPDEA